MLICGHRWGKPCLTSTILPVQAVDYHWFIPGAGCHGVGNTDADAVYNTSGIYDFPTMTVKDGAGQTYTYTAPGKLKVGGKGRNLYFQYVAIGYGCQRSGHDGCIGQRPFGQEGTDI